MAAAGTVLHFFNDLGQFCRQAGHLSGLAKQAQFVPLGSEDFVDNHFAADFGNIGPCGVFTYEPEGEPLNGKAAAPAVTGDWFSCEDGPLGLVCGLIGDEQYERGPFFALGQCAND